MHLVLGHLNLATSPFSFRSLEELHHKIDYFSHPDHRAERLEIATTLQRELRQRGDYGALAQEDRGGPCWPRCPGRAPQLERSGAPGGARKPLLQAFAEKGQT